jgi:hypothetical protein
MVALAGETITEASNTLFRVVTWNCRQRVNLRQVFKWMQDNDEVDLMCVQAHGLKGRNGDFSQHANALREFGYSLHIKKHVMWVCNHRVTPYVSRVGSDKEGRGLTIKLQMPGSSEPTWLVGLYGVAGAPTEIGEQIAQHQDELKTASEAKRRQDLQEELHELQGRLPPEGARTNVGATRKSRKTLPRTLHCRAPSPC